MDKVLLISLVSFLVICQADAKISWDSAKGKATISNGRLELTVDTKSGLNARLLRDVKTGIVYADRDYSWPDGVFPRLVAEPVIRTDSITFKAKLGDLLIEQTFEVPKREKGSVIERVTLSNPTKKSLLTGGFKCGFVLDAQSANTANMRICPVPYRRETNGVMQDFPLAEVIQHGTGFAGWFEPWTATAAWGAEGWVWTNGPSTLLLAKYNSNSMEWSLIEPLKRGNETQIRFAGAGQWKHGHPEGSTELAPGKSYTFGDTKIEAIDGDWKQAYYAYREWTESKGCKTPKGYNPPIHWNELYDNEYFGKVCAGCDQYVLPGGTGIKPEFWQINKKLLAENYTKEMMLVEAAKAKEIGCEALYMDPGWDIGANEQIWGADRFGPASAWTKRMADEFGLKVAVWCSLGHVPPTYGDPEACPPEARVLDQNGKMTQKVCFSSPAYLATKEKRLLQLSKDGLAFFMFDSDQFSGPCWDKSHGHHVPSTREDHANALILLAQKLRSKVPNLFIELHDPITGPSSIHYTPTYFGYARKNSFTELWGHEFMWGPMDDLLSRRAVSLYYYNLAYSIPIYLHVNLKSDNENALMFWWFASTVRHLGVGGKVGGPVWEAQKKAMAQYKSLKRFYTQGVFYGLDEMVIVHTLPDLKESVINVFNLEDTPTKKSFSFKTSDIGLSKGKMKIEGATFKQEGDEVSIDLEIPARGHQLIKVTH